MRGGSVTYRVAEPLVANRPHGSNPSQKSIIMSTDKTTSSGVQQLIDRLHEEGVEKGRTEADAVLAAARQQAMDLLDEARRQADEILIRSLGRKPNGHGPVARRLFAWPDGTRSCD